MDEFELEDIDCDVRKIRALVADDSSLMRHVLRGILSKIGIDNVQMANNGEEALELLRGGGINLVFADLKMPRLSGLKLLDRWRASEGYVEIPFIIISSEAGTESILEAGRHNATAYLIKPFSVEKVVFVLKKIYRSRYQWSMYQD